MKSYFKVSLALVASLVLLLGCSKQASTTASSSTKEDTNNSGITSTLVYTVEGDNVIKQSANNIADPEILGATPEDVKSFIEEKYKGYNGLKGVKQTIEIKDGKVVQDLEVDFSVASISELRKALPEEYSGIGNRVSFSNSKKALEKMGFTEKTN